MFAPNILHIKVHAADMGPTWGRQDPGGPHVGPMNLAIRDDMVHKYAHICGIWCVESNQAVTRLCLTNFQNQHQIHTYASPLLCPEYTNGTVTQANFKIRIFHFKQKYFADAQHSSKYQKINYAIYCKIDWEVSSANSVNRLAYLNIFILWWKLPLHYCNDLN